MPDEVQEGQVEEVAEEVKPDGEEQPEELSASEEPTEETQGEESKLPDDAKERTKKEFEKLKQHNAELKKQLDERKQLPSVLDYLNGPMPEITPDVRQRYQPQPQQMPYQQQNVPHQPKAPELVDEQGYVNADVLKEQLKTAEIARQKALEAERKALEAEQRIARFEQDAETKALYKAYPELDPMSEVFDRDAYDLVKNELTSQIVNSGKRDALSAADKMSKYFRKPQADPKKQKVIEQRNQASVPGSAPRQNGTTLSELKAMRGDEAIAERLRRLEAQQQ